MFFTGSTPWRAGPAPCQENKVELALILVSLLCPLLVVALDGPAQGRAGELFLVAWSHMGLLVAQPAQIMLRSESRALN